MSQETANKAILKEAYRQWHESKGGSVDVWMDCMADHIRFSSLANGTKGAEFTAPVQSKSDLKTYFEGLQNDFEMIHYTVDRFIAEGDSVVAIGSTSWRSKKTGKVVESPKCDVVRFENGKIVAFSEFYDTAMMIDAVSGE
ncbi:MAG: nuclear transport factor 2 family protein [Pseudomonadota bacterium]